MMYSRSLLSDDFILLAYLITNIVGISTKSGSTEKTHLKKCNIVHFQIYTLKWGSRTDFVILHHEADILLRSSRKSILRSLSRFRSNWRRVSAHASYINFSMILLQISKIYYLITSSDSPYISNLTRFIYFCEHVTMTWVAVWWWK